MAGARQHRPDHLRPPDLDHLTRSNDCPVPLAHRRNSAHSHANPVPIASRDYPAYSNGRFFVGGGSDHCTDCN